MAEDTGSAEAGNPAPEATAAPSAETSATTDTTSTSTPADPAPGRTPAEQAPWVDSIQNADTKAWAESKGLNNGSFENVVKSYHNLEKLMGADRAGRTVTILGDDATPEQFSEFYNKLGRPKEAKEYTFVQPEGQGPERLEAMRGKAHALGITDAQFTGMAQADLEYMAGLQTTFDDDADILRIDAEAALKKEWGAAYDQKVTGINVAAEKLGFSQDQLAGLHAALGPVEAMKFVDSLNTKMGDHDFTEGVPNVSGMKTPEQARQELGELTMTKEFMDAWLDKAHPGHNAAVAKKATLAKFAAGDTP